MYIIVTEKIAQVARPGVIVIVIIVMLLIVIVMNYIFKVMESNL